MHVPSTLALFASILALLVVLRIRWSKFSTRFRRLVVSLACMAIVAEILSRISRWSINSDLMDALLYWAAMTSYEFFVLLLTLLRPRWLTATIAIILILPLFSASIFLPLGRIFDRNTYRVQPLGSSLVNQITPWDSVLQGTSGVDSDISEINSHVPFLRHHLGGVRFYNNQCNTSGLEVRLLPNSRNVHFHCPSWSPQPGDEGNGTVLELP